MQSEVQVRLNSRETEMMEQARRSLYVQFPDGPSADKKANDPATQAFSTLGVFRSQNSPIGAKMVTKAYRTFKNLLPVLVEQSTTEWWMQNCTTPTPSNEAIDTLRDRGGMPLVLDPKAMIDYLAEIRQMQVQEVRRAIALCERMLFLTGPYVEADPEDDADDSYRDVDEICEQFPLRD